MATQALTAFSEEALHICNDILGFDDSVLYAGIVDELGNVIGESLSSKGAEERSHANVPAQIDNYYGTQAAVLKSILKLGEGAFGESEYMVLSYKNHKILIVPEREGNCSFLLALSAKADMNRIARHILDMSQNT